MIYLDYVLFVYFVYYSNVHLFTLFITNLFTYLFRLFLVYFYIAYYIYQYMYSYNCMDFVNDIDLLTWMFVSLNR